MSKTTKATPAVIAPVVTAAAPAAAPAPKKQRTPDPVLDHAKALTVPPYRHTSGRTIGQHQSAGEGAVHRFSPTGNFIDTVKADEAAKFEPKKPAAPAAAPVAEPAPAPATETPATS